MEKITKESAIDYAEKVFMGTVVNSLEEQMLGNIQDIVTTVGSFVIRRVRDKFQRSVVIECGIRYGDSWMEDALYAILYQHNKIKNMSRLSMSATNNSKHNSDNAYYKLQNGTYSLKYRNYNIVVVVQHSINQVTMGRSTRSSTYTIMTYNLSPNFVSDFEKDMINHRNALLKIKSDSPTVTLYQDYHESDGYTYWTKHGNVPKRKMNTIYLPDDQKRLIVSTINTFIQSKDYYNKHGITHNLKILLYGKPGYGKDSIARMIASEWNRNIYYVTGGKNGKFVPDALTSTSDDIVSPLFIVSDIDKYPFLITDTKVDLVDDSKSEKSSNSDRVDYKQTFGKMINALDGILSGEDKIIVMTTNHIELFSEVFYRPGRVDLMLEINSVDSDTFKRYVKDLYNVDITGSYEIKDDVSISALQFDAVFMKMSANDFIDKYRKIVKDIEKKPEVKKVASKSKLDDSKSDNDK